MDLRAAATAAGPANRRRHYAAFYGTHAIPDSAPLVLVHGNCQAESLRLVLGGDDLVTVRIPPAHELTAEDLGPLRRLLARAAVVVSQPIRAGYRGLPIGTSEVLAQTAARPIIVPVIRYAGLYPAQAIVRVPATPSLNPPLVPYHDLRVLAHAAGLAAPAGDAARLTADRLRAIAADSVAELRRRELAHGTVVISDLFSRPRFSLMRTINHPGNPIWAALGRRVRAAAGLSDTAQDPGRPLLDMIHAPREAAVIDGLGLEEAPQPDWIVDGERIEVETVREAHLRWYEDHPETVAAGLSRHSRVLAMLGLR
jgi:hypothetical protein